jgi:hypothetical protein
MMNERNSTYRVSFTTKDLIRFRLKCSIVLFFLCSFNSNAQSGSSTTFAPTLLTKMGNGNNIVYCATMELLWHDVSNHLGGTLKTTEKNELIKDLNRSKKYFEVPLDSAFWFTEIGTIDDGLYDAIQNQFSKKFNISWEPPIDMNNEGLLGYTFLKKEVDFYEPLPDEIPMMTFNDSLYVWGFGQKGSAVNGENEQLIIHDYKDEDNFILEIKCLNSLDEIYLAKVPQKHNLKSTYLSVMDRIGSNADSVKKYDQIYIPYLKFDETISLIDEENLVIAIDRNADFVMTTLSQWISFDLNKEGIKVESDTRTMIDIYELNTHKIYAFDQPFLIIMKRRGTSTPYLLFWVANTDHMRPANMD